MTNNENLDYIADAYDSLVNVRQLLVYIPDQEARDVIKIIDDKLEDLFGILFDRYEE